MKAGPITDDIKLMIIMIIDSEDKSFYMDNSNDLFYIENDNPKCDKKHLKPLLDNYDIFWRDNNRWWRLVRNERYVTHIDSCTDYDMIKLHLKEYYDQTN